MKPLSSPLHEAFQTAHATAQHIRAAYERITARSEDRTTAPLTGAQAVYGHITADLVNRQMHEQYNSAPGALNVEYFKRTTLRYMATRSPLQPMSEPGTPYSNVIAWFGADELLLYGVMDSDDTYVQAIYAPETSTVPTLLVCWLAIHDELVAVVDTMHEAYTEYRPPVPLVLWQTAMRYHVLHAVRYAVQNIPHYDDTPWAWQHPIVVEQLHHYVRETKQLHNLVDSLYGHWCDST